MFPPVSNAAEFLSKQYGFRFAVPSGFDEMPDDAPRAIKTFIDRSKGLSDWPITIRVKRAGGEFNASYKIDISKFKNSDSSKYSLETRHWQEIDLEVLRSEMELFPNDPSLRHVNIDLVIVFPLKNEGVVLEVHGPISRVQEILHAFNESVQSFTSLKPYIVGDVTYYPRTMTRSALEFAANYILPLAIVGVVGLWMWRVRKVKKP
jgi:hypothetical protein